jgi:hypothetical protein
MSVTKDFEVANLKIFALVVEAMVTVDNYEKNRRVHARCGIKKAIKRTKKKYFEKKVICE